MVLEEAAGVVRPLTGSAVNDELPVAGQFCEALAEFIEREVLGAGNKSLGPFRGAPHVQHQRSLGLLLSHLMPVNHGRFAFEDILGRHTRQIHRVLGRSEGRRISQFQLGQIIYVQAGLKCRSQNVDPLVHALASDCLSAE